jgi:hypothetical protein
MNARIEIEVRNVYGVPTLYPVNDQAKLLAKLAGTKTLTNATLAVAEQMGFSIVTVSKPASWKVGAA